MGRLARVFGVATVAVLLSVAVPGRAQADIGAWKACMERTLGNHVLQSILGNIRGILDNIEARAQCLGLLTPEEEQKLYNENKGWYDLFRPGGPLDPTRPGYSNRI